MKSQRARKIAVCTTLCVSVAFIAYCCRPAVGVTYGDHTLDYWLSSPDEEYGGVDSVEMLVSILKTIDVPDRTMLSRLSSPTQTLSSAFQGTLSRDLDYASMIAATHRLVPRRINEIAAVLKQGSISPDAKKQQKALIGLALVQEWRKHPEFGPRCTTATHQHSN
jgi:hypothetical protein